MGTNGRPKKAVWLLQQFTILFLIAIVEAIGLTLAFFVLLIFVLAFFSPETRNQFQQGPTIIVTAFVVFVILRHVQLWREERDHLSTKENTVFLILFALYGSAAYGGVRYMLFELSPQAYSISLDLKREAREREIAQTERIIAQSQKDTAFLNELKNTIARTCRVHLVDTWRNYWSLAVRGAWSIPASRWSDTNPSQPFENCDVWVLRESGNARPLVFNVSPQKLPSTNFILYEQLISREYRFFAK